MVMNKRIKKLRYKRKRTIIENTYKQTIKENNKIEIMGHENNSFLRASDKSIILMLNSCFVLLMKSHLQSYPCPLIINYFWNLGFY